MASNFYLPDGRDFDQVFYQSNGGQTTGYKVADGTDLGNRYVAGNSGINTGYKLSNGVDLGSVLGTATHTIKITYDVGTYNYIDPNGGEEIERTGTYYRAAGKPSPVASVIGNISEIYTYSTSSANPFTDKLETDINTSSQAAGACYMKRLDTGAEIKLSRSGNTYRIYGNEFFKASDNGKTIPLIIRL